jgi:hypothetical protein
MYRRVTPIQEYGRGDDDNMVVSPDERSIHRGRRRAPRTNVLRPCLVWYPENPEERMQGVLLDLTPWGMRLRMLDLFREGSRLTLQMMRDEEFREPLSAPLHVKVVRIAATPEGFYDLGLTIQHATIRKAESSAPVRIERPKPAVRRSARMYSVDLETGGRGGRRTGRNRG